ncbi:histidinol dehydrogenase [Pseudomonas aeruginosa]
MAALAYGTESVPQVDKIVGPGNIYVATAKRHVFGQVGIDMIAGPSEILVVCDGQTDPDWIAMDLFSRAEHDEDAQSILAQSGRGVPGPRRGQHCSPAADHGARRDHPHLPGGARRADPGRRPGPGLVRSPTASPRNTWSCRWPIRKAGCRRSAMPARSSWAATLPRPWATIAPARTTCCRPPVPRFSSPLGVYDFQKRSSIINCSAEGASVLGRTASVLARGESLTAHARECRIPHPRREGGLSMVEQSGVPSSRTWCLMCRASSRSCRGWSS